ncbi:MAG: Holliday junction resolvase-like protein [Dehalococcoidia bacterium]|nr:Holliday junction resolvase-like protein [Dehalococcoidia bacterium]
MDTAVYVIFAVVVLVLLAVIVVLALRPRRIELPDFDSMERKLLFALASSQTSVKEIQEILKGLPRDVMQSITGSLSQRTGKLNELMATFEMTHYDRLFYLGEPIDFVGIKYDEGVDFIEVKTGRFRLTEDEKKLRDLIETGRVNYVPLTVKRIGIAEEMDTGE